MNDSYEFDLTFPISTGWTYSKLLKYFNYSRIRPCRVDGRVVGWKVRCFFVDLCLIRRVLTF